MKAHPHAFNFSERPFLVIWETTRACDLACVHCRAEAEPNPKPDELTHEEALDLVSQVRKMKTPILVFSGGDPLKRKDLPELIRYAKSLGLRTGAIPAATPALTPDSIRSLKDSGLDQIAFSLDSAVSEEHDRFRQVPGVFERTLQSVRYANERGLAVQINSLVNVHNEKQLELLIRLVEGLDIVFWEVFFLVPVGRGKELPLMSAQKFEEAFSKIYDLSQKASFVIKITEAPQYRRYYIEQRMREQGIDSRRLRLEEINLPAYLTRAKGPGGSIGRAPQGVNAGKGFVFISYNGEVLPSGFLPLSGGSIRRRSLAEIYQNAPLFRELRDPSRLKGRCGICPYREVCGGSRSRAYALTGDYLEEDSACVYQPAPPPNEPLRDSIQCCCREAAKQAIG